MGVGHVLAYRKALGLHSHLYKSSRTDRDAILGHTYVGVWGAHWCHLVNMIEHSAVPGIG